MAQQQPSSSAGSSAKEYIVRLPKDHKKKYSIMKFSPADKVDFVNTPNVKIERENNLKDYKAAYDVDTMPKFGAGSEFGRDQKEEARRKKYGIMRKRYNPYDQPWILRMGKSKNDKKFKGSKSIGMLENAKYYIFTQHADKAFEAYPIEEWFDFNPVSKFKSLDADEAEEQFSKRDKTLNYFSIMVKKRIKGDDATEDDDDPSEKKSKGKKKKKEFKLSDMDDWDGISDEASEPSDSEDEEKKKKKDSDSEEDMTKKKAKGKGKGKKGFKRNSEDEAMEESDEADEGEEVDYMSDSTSDDEDPYEDKDREEDVYNDKGVDQEEGLNKILNSDDEDEEEQKEENEDDDNKEDKAKGSDSDSSGSSGSDSDIEKDPSINSALFLQKKPLPEKRQRKPSLSSEGSGATNSRSNTPIVSEEAKSRDTDSPAPKKARTELPASSSTSSTSELSMQETVRRYLMRKPMTTKDILQKIKSKNTGVPKDKLVTTLTQILKKLNPDAKKIQDKLYLSLKKTD